MFTRERQRGRGYRRTVVAAAVSSGFLLAGLAPATSAGAGTQVGAPVAAFSNGQAKATALVAKVAPGVGSLELAIASGVAVAELKNNLTQSEATSLDLGLIGSVLTAGSGCGSGAGLTPDDLPQPTRVDNRGGPTRQEASEAPVGDMGGAGHTVAEAGKLTATAIATTAFGLVPGITIEGGQAKSTTRVVDGNAREARAEVTMSIDFGGALQLSGMTWEATHRTGANPSATASFDIGTAKLLGVPLPLESLVEAQTLVNAALKPTGLSITFPKVERFKEPADLIRITPMRITMKDGDIGSQLVSPVLTATRAEREQLFTTIGESICELASAPLVLDIGLSVAAGTGFLIADIGGAEAISGDLILGNPFGPPVAPTQSQPLPTPAGPVAAPSAPPAPPAPPSVDTPPAPTPTPTADIGPLEKICETIHPFRSPGCSEGAMAPLGFAGLAATGVIGALDWRHQRRRLAGQAVPA